MFNLHQMFASNLGSLGVFVLIPGPLGLWPDLSLGARLQF